MLTNADIAELTAFRRDLHRWPEVSGEEEQTARTTTTNMGAAVAATFGSGPLGLFDAALHNPDYDFPDDLIPVGARIYAQIVHDILG